MSDPQDPQGRAPGATGPESPDERRARIQRTIDAGREAELNEDDYTYAIQNGLIEG